MTEDLCYDDGSDLRRLYEQVHGGPGVRVVDPSVAGLRSLHRWASGSAERVSRALRAAGADWQGAAADASASAMHRVIRWAERGAPAAGNGGERVQDYASSFAEMKPKIVPPKPVPPPTIWDDMFPTRYFGVTDHAAAVADNAAATKAAFAAYSAHDANTRAAVDAFPTLDPVLPPTRPGDGRSGNVPGPRHLGPPGAHPGPAPTDLADLSPSAPPAAPPGAWPGHSPAPGQPGPSGLPVPGFPGLRPPSGHSARPPAPGRAPGTPPFGEPGRPGQPPLPPGRSGLPNQSGPPGAPNQTGLPGGTNQPNQTGLPGGTNQPGQTGGPNQPGQTGGPNQAGQAGGPNQPGQSGVPRGLGPPERPYGPGLAGEPAPGGTGPGGRPGIGPGVPGIGPGIGPGGMPLAGGMLSGDRQHRNNVFLPSDEPFSAGIGDDAVPPVLGPDQEPW
ncbi:hypothetical protein GCM10023321_28580 [Pseudonocardia eucalypti]|uniref:PPE family protein n=1 Tax=Pseudonocardia eucalypti TaxID=648755 RepID=A0ABP9Q3F7_9PSEU|nr:hypothetical protein [Pseudonocardia eucalypti]